MSPDNARMRLLPMAVLLLLAAAPAATERQVEDTGIVTLTLGTVPLRVRISPAAPAMPIFSQAAADRAGMKGGPSGAQFVIGPVKHAARTRVATLAIGDSRFERLVAWTPEPFAPGLDGVIGPGGLPDPVVRFVLGSPRVGERTLSLPLDGSHPGFSAGTAMLGGVKTAVRFDPQAPRTVASAAVGVALANAHRGVLSGDPQPVLIAFGVSRPVRTLTLGEPAALGPLVLSSIAVRVGDGGAANTIREADADPDEVLVAAKGKRGRAGLLIGRDLLGRCSSLVFDKPAKVVRLTCG
jgi:hypothetical protein